MGAGVITPSVMPKSFFWLWMETCSAGARGDCCLLAKLGSQGLFTALPLFFLKKKEISSVLQKHP